MKVLNGQVPLTAGRLRIAGRDVTGISAVGVAALGVCTIPEGRGLFANLTVRENLMMAAGHRAPQADMDAAAYARFPSWGSVATSRRAPLPAVSSRCSRCPVRSAPGPPCCCSTSSRWVSRR